MLCADDDFLIINGLKKAIKFLQANSNYGSCGGRQYNHNAKIDSTLLMKYKFNLIYGDKLNFRQSDDPLNRVKEYLNGQYKYHPFYHVHRSQAHKKIWKSTAQSVSDFGLSEIHSCAASLIMGKIKVLNHAFVSREPNTYNWIDASKIEVLYSDNKIEASANGLGKLFENKKDAAKKIFKFLLDYKSDQVAKYANSNHLQGSLTVFQAIKERLAIRSRVFFSFIIKFWTCSIY